jgi:hypothetical protein
VDFTVLGHSFIGLNGGPNFKPNESVSFCVYTEDQEETDRNQLRKRYSGLVRRYHPDKNGGDRSHEGRLGEVIEAYQLLRKAAALA